MGECTSRKLEVQVNAEAGSACAPIGVWVVVIVVVGMSVTSAVVAMGVRMGATNNALTARTVAANDLAMTAMHQLHIAGLGQVDRCDAPWHGFCRWSDKGETGTNSGRGDERSDLHDFSFSLLASPVLGSSLCP